jgi:hypothetical protein
MATQYTQHDESQSHLPNQIVMETEGASILLYEDNPVTMTDMHRSSYSLLIHLLFFPTLQTFAYQAHDGTASHNNNYTHNYSHTCNVMHTHTETSIQQLWKLK